MASTTPSGRVRVGASPASVFVLTILSFAAGALAGAIATHQVLHSRGEADWTRRGTSWKEDQVEGWAQKLDLDASQKKSLEKAIDDVYARYRALYAEMSPRRHAIDEDLHAKVRAFLDDRQRAQYEAALAAAEAKRRSYYGPVDPSALARPIREASEAAPPAPPPQ